MIGYEYGNTRLRVRAANLFDRAAYQGLMAATSIDGLLGALAHSPYASDVEFSLGRHTGIARLDEAVRHHLSGELSDVLSFYEGDIRKRLRLYESRWDLRNLRTILRDLAGRGSAEPTTSWLVAAGNLDAAALREVAGRPDVRAAVDLLGLWQLPSPGIVRNLRRALPDHARTGDIAILEEALDRGFGEAIAELVASAASDLVTRLLQRLVDRLNLMRALRWQSSQPSGDREFEPIPGGRLTDGLWRDAAQFGDRQNLGDLLSLRIPQHWRSAFGRWVEHGDLAQLETDLDVAEAKLAARTFVTGDPLGIEIPVSYIDRVEAEAKNLRLIGRTLSHDLPRDDVLGHLMGVS